jgi:hypothetical protein
MRRRSLWHDSALSRRQGRVAFSGNGLSGARALAGAVRARETSEAASFFVDLFLVSDRRGQNICSSSLWAVYA